MIRQLSGHQRHLAFFDRELALQAVQSLAALREPVGVQRFFAKQRGAPRFEDALLARQNLGCGDAGPSLGDQPFGKGDHVKPVSLGAQPGLLGLVGREHRLERRQRGPDAGPVQSEQNLPRLDHAAGVVRSTPSFTIS